MHGGGEAPTARAPIAPATIVFGWTGFRMPLCENVRSTREGSMIRMTVPVTALIVICLPNIAVGEPARLPSCPPPAYASNHFCLDVDGDIIRTSPYQRIRNFTMHGRSNDAHNSGWFWFVNGAFSVGRYEQVTISLIENDTGAIEKNTGLIVDVKKLWGTQFGSYIEGWVVLHDVLLQQITTSGIVDVSMGCGDLGAFRTPEVRPLKKPDGSFWNGKNEKLEDVKFVTLYARPHDSILWSDCGNVEGGPPVLHRQTLRRAARRGSFYGLQKHYIQWVTKKNEHAYRLCAQIR
jgi:hypothetical protein